MVAQSVEDWDEKQRLSVPHPMQTKTWKMAEHLQGNPEVPILTSGSALNWQLPQGCILPFLLCSRGRLQPPSCDPKRDKAGKEEKNNINK